MRFFIGFISLLFLCCSAEKTEKKPLSLCETGIDSLLRSSQVKYYIDGDIRGFGYVEGHCLDSERSLSLYTGDIEGLEYGNFKTGHYIVDSVLLPFFGFEAFKNRQQIISRDLYCNDTVSQNLFGFFKSIYPYKNKIFGLTRDDIIIMDVQKKSLEGLVHYDLFELVNFETPPSMPVSIGKDSPERISLGLIRIENDTIIASRRLPDNGFIDTILITLDGNNFIPKIRDDLCLEIILSNGENKYVGDIERCFGEYNRRRLR